RGQVERELTGIIDNLCITDIPDLGLNEPEISKFVLSPNPVADKLKINNSQAVKIAMYDYHGRLVYTNHFDSSGEIDMTSFESGVYFVEIESNGSVETHRIVKL